jgi:FkbM family methyltransferase
MPRSTRPPSPGSRRCRATVSSILRMHDSRLRSLVFRSQAATRVARTAKAVVRRLTMEVHDPDFYALECLQAAEGLALDIGANTGQSAVSILAVKPGFTVLSLEPNPTCEPPLSILSTLFGSRLRVLHVGAADKPGDLPFYVPLRRGRELLEEGTFDIAGLSDPATVKRIGYRGADYTLREISCPIVRVDDLNQNPVFVKIDVQGLELEVLRGMQSTIRSSRPMIMIERSTDEDDCTSFLNDFGYNRRYWNGKIMTELPGDSINAFYLQNK